MEPQGSQEPAILYQIIHSKKVYKIQTAVFRVVMQCSAVIGYRRFGRPV